MILKYREFLQKAEPLLNRFPKNIGEVRQLLKSKNMRRYSICLLISGSIWLLINLSKKYTHHLTFNVYATNIPTRIGLTDTSPRTIRVTLTTYGFDLLQQLFGSETVFVSTEAMRVFNSRYIWTPKQFLSKVPSFFGHTGISEIYPDTISFPFKIKDVKRVPVSSKNIQVKYAPGYLPLKDRIALEPDSVDLIGTFHQLKTIQSVETETFIQSEVRETFEKELRLKELSEKDIILGVHTVRLRSVVRLFTELILQIPIQPKNQVDSLNVKFYPSKCEVRFLVSIDSVKAISPSDFRVICDMKGFQNKKTLPLKMIEKPIYIKNLKYLPQKVEFLVSPK